MAKLPVLFSPVRTLYSTIPTLPTAPTAVTVGQMFISRGRIIQCVEAGTTANGSMPSSLHEDLMATYVDTDTFRVVTFGTAKFRDITGHPNFGWSYAVPSIGQLYAVNNPNQSYSLSTIERPTLGRQTVLFDSECELWLTRSTIPRDTGIAMWGYWDVTNELYSGDVGYETSVTIGQPAQTEIVAYISVDAESPTYASKKGATMHFQDKLTGTYIIGGYGYMEGFVLDILTEVYFSGAPMTICHMWFEDCDWSIAGPLSTAVYGRSDGAVGSASTYIDLMFRRCDMVFRKGGEYRPAGKACFEDTRVSRTEDAPILDLKDTYMNVSFIGVDFSGLVGDSPLATSTSYCPRAEIRYEGCVGLKRSHVVPPFKYGLASYRIEVFGGELDGVMDTDRYLLWTEHYEMVHDTDHYAYSSATGDGYGLVTYRYSTYAHLELGVNFCVLQKLTAWAEAGVYEVSIRLLVPSGVSLTADNLWLDISTTGVTQGQIHSSRGVAACVSEDMDTTWVKPEGFTAYRVTIPAVHDVDGMITGSIYCVIPSVVLYLSGNLHAMKVV